MRPCLSSSGRFAVLPCTRWFKGPSGSTDHRPSSQAHSSRKIAEPDSGKNKQGNFLRLRNLHRKADPIKCSKGRGKPSTPSALVNGQPFCGGHAVERNIPVSFWYRSRVQILSSFLIEWQHKRMPRCVKLTSRAKGSCRELPTR